jgi:hypothetical protein
MRQIINHVASTKEEVLTTLEFLDKASLVPIKIVDNGVEKEIKNFVGIYNNSTGKFCCSTIPHYNLIQHKQYFLAAAQALDRLNIKYTMNIKQEGNRAFCDFNFKDRNIKFEKVGEEFTTGIRFINSYDKSRGLHIVPRFTRLACTNGMILSTFKDVLSIKHHTKLAGEIHKLVEVKLSEMITESKELGAWVSNAMQDSIEWNTACKIIGKLFEQLKHREMILKNLNIDVIEVENELTKKKSIAYVWTDKTKSKNKFTRWEIYNSITNYLTHGEQITPHIENLFHQKAGKLLVTALVKMPVEKGL